MGRFRTVLVIAAAVSLLAATPALARPEERDLGPVPQSGDQAASTMEIRAATVVREMACGDEARFLGREGNLLRFVPSTDKKDPDVPVSQLTAKVAAWRASPLMGSCHVVQEVDPDDWSRELVQANASTPFIPSPTSPAMPSHSQWKYLKDAAALLDDGVRQAVFADSVYQLRADQIAQQMRDEINGLENNEFGENCAGAAHEVRAVRTGDRFVYSADLIISAACLQSQVAKAVNAHALHRVGNPGTDPQTCIFGSKSKGDWDQGVMPLVRLTYLLRLTRQEIGLSQDGLQALDKLQSRLLTISGEPASETYNIILSCGNPINSYGTASDRVNDNSVFDSDLGHTVEGSGEGDNGDFWRDLAKWLAFLAVLAVLVAAAVALALAAAAAVSAGLLLPFIGLLAVLAVLGIPQLLIGLVFGGFEETENHLLMENTSIYLTNKILIAEARADGDDASAAELEGDNEDVHDWLMKRLQRIAKEDFAEYNAKPYARLSILSILNLHDFACETSNEMASARQCPDADKHLMAATAGVLDLTAAKAALGSEQGIRFIPFRRRAETNTNNSEGHLTKAPARTLPYHILGPTFWRDERGGDVGDLSLEADHLVSVLQFWTGQSVHGKNGRASAAMIEEEVPHATSTYRPPAMILDMAIDKSTPYQQTLHHAGWERYSSGPGWLLTAGGTRTPSAQGLRWVFGTMTSGIPGLFIQNSDIGAGVPTTLIVASTVPGQDRLTDFIRFEGHIKKWEADKDSQDEPETFDDNFCVSGSFACGINMQVPPAVRGCMKSLISAPDKPYLNVSYVDSSTCAAWQDDRSDNDFYAIVYSQSCGDHTDGCAAGAHWGFIEIVAKTDWPDLTALGAKILASNSGNFQAMGRAGGDGEATYVSLANGTLTFEPAGSYVSKINGRGADSSEPDWQRADGPISADGDARFIIRAPNSGKTETVDFTDRENPSRVLP